MAEQRLCQSSIHVRRYGILSRFRQSARVQLLKNAMRAGDVHDLHLAELLADGHCGRISSHGDRLRGCRCAVSGDELRERIDVGAGRCFDHTAHATQPRVQETLGYTDCCNDNASCDNLSQK